MKWLWGMGAGVALCLGVVSTGQTALSESRVSGPPWEVLLGRGQVPEAKRDEGGPSRFLMAPHDSAHSFDVRYYQLDLGFAMTNTQFGGDATILCTSNQSGLDTLSLDCLELTVDSIRVDGNPAAIDTGLGKININLGRPYALGENFQIFIGYHGEADTVYDFTWFPAGMSWFRRGRYGSSTPPETTAYSMAEPSDARRWFPCFDEPWDKADSSKINATVPKRYQVASNGLLTSVDTVGGSAIYRWSETHPISTYLMSVAISKYAVIHDQYISPNQDTIPITHYVYHADSAAAAAGYQNVPDMMAFYSDTFCEYPFSKYGMAVVSPFGGGMEHQTMTSIIRYYDWEEGIAHEFAHMWWGDMITCADWPNIWLNEGFATYAEALWTEHWHGESAFQTEMAANQQSYFNQAAYYDFPIYNPPEAELFNGGIIYAKGACILHMLRYVLGEEKFWGIWPVYADSFKYGNANTPDFQRICEQVSGQDLNWFFQEWVYDLGYPVYGYAWRSDSLGSSQWQLTVQVEQFQTQGPIFRMPLDFRFTGLFVDTTLSGVDSLQRQEFQFVVNLASAPTSMAFDPDNWITDVHDTIPFVGVTSGGNRSALPTRCELGQNFPNPMKGETRIQFAIPRETPVRLTLYNLLGQTVRVLVDGKLNAGYHTVPWDGRDLKGEKVSSGVYLYELEGAGFGATRRLSVLR